MTTAGSCTVIDGSDSAWGSEAGIQLLRKEKEGEEKSHYMHFDGNSLKANGPDAKNGIFKIHKVSDSDEKTIVILEHIKSQGVVTINTKDDTVMAVDKENDTVTLKDPPVDITQITEKDGSIDKSHPEILFYKIWRRPGSKWFYLKSLKNDKIVGFNENGELKTTTVAGPESLFKIESVDLCKKEH